MCMHRKASKVGAPSPSLEGLASLVELLGLVVLASPVVASSPLVHPPEDLVAPLAYLLVGGPCPSMAA
jgi:hypothetical protein